MWIWFGLDGGNKSWLRESSRDFVGERVGSEGVNYIHTHLTSHTSHTPKKPPSSTSSFIQTTKFKHAVSSCTWKIYKYRTNHPHPHHMKQVLKYLPLFLFLFTYSHIHILPRYTSISISISTHTYTHIYPRTVKYIILHK